VDALQLLVNLQVDDRVQLHLTSDGVRAIDRGAS
jgi:hypothetical protein